MKRSSWWFDPVGPMNIEAYQQACQHQQQLTKPAGSLGRLEQLAQSFARWQGQALPELEHILVTVFAGDHGVCAHGVSAFPQAVTTQMICNFLSGGAAISVLSRALDAQFSVVNMGTVEPLPAMMLEHPYLTPTNIAHSTADFTAEPAMTPEQLAYCLNTGREAVTRQPTAQLFIGGEMGIGNTTSASAIYAAVMGLSVSAAVGPGTGVDDEGLQRKQRAVKQALSLHQSTLDDPLDILRCVGGFEIAALVGSYIACAQQGTPVVVDGFICTAAALLAVAINPGVQDWLLFSHCSAEPAHRLALEYLEAKPLLDLGMRLGEGSGAAIVVPIIQSALLLHREMATFEQAGVSDTNKEPQ